MKRFQLILTAALPALLLAGCNRPALSAPAPTPAQQAELQAADACASLASGLKLANDSIVSLAQAGLATAQEEASIHATLAAIAVKNDQAIAAIKAAESDGLATGWEGELQAVASAASTLTPASVNIHNPQAAQKFALALGVFESAVAVIENNLGGAL